MRIGAGIPCLDWDWLEAAPGERRLDPDANAGAVGDAPGGPGAVGAEGVGLSPLLSVSEGRGWMGGSVDIVDAEEWMG
jgi:hypothetical protein